MESICNATIIKTQLGELGRGPSFMLVLEYGDDTQQCFGGYFIEDTQGVELLLNVLKVVAVDKWELLSGKHIRVKYEDRGFDRKISSIGHLINDVWIDSEKLNIWK